MLEKTQGNINSNRRIKIYIKVSSKLKGHQKTVMQTANLENPQNIEEEKSNAVVEEICRVTMLACLRLEKATKCLNPIEKISNINDELVNINNEYLQQVNQLTKSNQTLEELVTEYKNKNDTLAGTLTEYKAEHENNKILQDKIRELERKLNDLNIVAENQAKTIIESDVIKQEQALKHSRDIDDLHAKYENEIETLKARADIEMSKKILELQQQYQTKIQALQEKHNQDIEQYQVKYKELLERMETKKKPTSNKVKETKDLHKA